MGYIDKNLLPGEKILFRTKKHVIIFLVPILWSIFSIYAFSYMHANEILTRVEWAPWVVALILWFYALLEYAFSEFVVTDKRLMMREGFFYRHTNEMRLSTISQVNVDQSLIGQYLDYGDVSINAFGAFDSYSLIAGPNTFQKYVNEQLDILTSR
jgi:uncharacterized membrane protein YdbT with pleckstrin-like domain